MREREREKRRGERGESPLKASAFQRKHYNLTKEEEEEMDRNDANRAFLSYKLKHTPLKLFPLIHLRYKLMKL